VPDSYSPIDDVLLYTAITDSRYSSFALSLSDRRATPLQQLESPQPITPVFSPNGLWIAYTSMETGQAQVFVQPFPATGDKYQVSRQGGHHPFWSPDGRELTYDVTAGVSEVVSIVTSPTFTVGNPQRRPRGGMLFAGTQSMRPIDMAPDGRILGRMDGEQQPGSTPQIRIVLNWFEELKQRVPSR
jgi:hypothetical protein